MSPFFKIVFISILTVVVGTTNLFAQTNLNQNKADSLKNAISLKRTADSLVREIVKQKNKAYLDSIKNARVLQKSVDSFKRVQAKQALLQRKIKFSDSVRLEKERVALEKKEALAKNAINSKSAKKIRELWVADSLKQIEVAEKMIQRAKRLRIDDSMQKIELAQKELFNKLKAENELKEKLAKQEQKRVQDSISLVELEKKKQQAINEKLAKQEQKRIKDSIKKVEIAQRKQQAINEKLAKQEQKRIQDSLKNLNKNLELKSITKSEISFKKDSLETKTNKQLKLQKKYEKDSLKTSLKNQKKREQDSLMQVKAQQQEMVQEKVNAKMDSLNVYQKKFNDSINAIAQENQRRIHDSLEIENERIRLMNLKYRKQTIEDSLFLLAQSQPNLNQDSILKSILNLEEEIRIKDSVAKAKVEIPKIEILIDTIITIPKISSSPVDTNFIFVENKRATQISFIIGSSNYLGDLGGNSGIGKGFFYDNNSKQRTFFYGIGLSRYYKSKVGIRINYVAGKIAGGDYNVTFKDLSDPAYYRYKRNLDFQSKISELSCTTEILPLKFFKNKACYSWNLQPYCLAGLGIYSFNAQGSYYDEIADDYVWVDLKPLRLEGQGMSEFPTRKIYANTQVNIPYGLGIQYNIGKKTFLSFEFVGRKLFTDYLDDVSTTFINPNLFDKYLNKEEASIAKIMSNKSNQISPDQKFQVGEQRGNPKYNDFYYSFNFKLSIQLSQSLKKKKRF